MKNVAFFCAADFSERARLEAGTWSGRGCSTTTTTTTPVPESQSWSRVRSGFKAAACQLEIARFPTRYKVAAPIEHSLCPACLPPCPSTPLSSYLPASHCWPAV